MIIRWNDYQTADRLEQPQFQRWRGLQEVDRRSLIKIGIIDDAPFPYRENLENMGYKIEILGDPQSIVSTQSSHVVLCDLQGVGLRIDPTKQGAFIINEIKRNYPEKMVIAYTGGGMNLAITRDALKSADNFIKKDAPIDDWREVLDSAILSMLDPAKVWNRQRIKLFERGIDTYSILKIEDSFVRSIAEGQSADNSYFKSYILSSSVKGDLRAVLQSLISSGLYSILSGN